jgi:hypothetical protein
MKKIFLLFVLLLGLVFTSYAQNEETVTVKKSDLTAQQLAKVNAETAIVETQTAVQKYGYMAGVGKEVGVAIRDGLSSVVDVSDKFSKTDVGKFTMVIIAWKFLYKDIVRILIGILFIVLLTWIIFKSYRNLIPHKERKSGVWYQFWVTKEYEIIQPNDFEGREFVKVLLLFLMAGGFGIGYAIMFG